MRTRALVGAALVALFASESAFAIDAGDARRRASSSIRKAQRKIPKIRLKPSGKLRGYVTVPERLVSGEIMLQSKDYEGAIDVFSQVLELKRQGKAPEAAGADAEFRLGEAYFHSGQYLSARRHFTGILDRVARPPYRQYAGRALGRLIDVALRTGDQESLEQVIARLGQLPVSDNTGSLQYARAKARFAQGDYGTAKQVLASIPASSPYQHQAQYLLGAVLTEEAAPPEEKGEKKEGPVRSAKVVAQAKASRYAVAIEQFRKVTRLKADTAERSHIVDLAWLAIGRLLNESDNSIQAAEAYSRVGRSSPEFATMLYELAWVYARLGDAGRAQRALEVLDVLDPGHLDAVDGKLLHADLLLRTGEFKKALTLYEEVRGRFDPLRNQVDRFLTVNTNPAVYYDKLVTEEIAQQGGELSPLVIRWAREEAENGRAFAVIDEVTHSRDLVKRSQKLVRKLNTVLASPTRTRAFPELRAALEQTLSLLNSIGKARLTLARGVDDAQASPPTPAQSLYAQRRALMRRMGKLPVSSGDFIRRETAGERQWNKTSQRLHALNLEVDRLQAMVNALRKVAKEGDKYGVQVTPAARSQLAAELSTHEKRLKEFRAALKQYREIVEVGRVQVGFGDQRYVNDDRVRRQFREVFSREVHARAASGGSGGEYCRSIMPLLQQADAAEAQLESMKARLERQAAQRSQDLKRMVAREAANIEAYKKRLDALDSEARLVVGTLAMHNVGLVRDRLKSVVLRADVGMVQQAWEVREEQMRRVRNLQRERAREDRSLNDELREVLDDAGEEP